MVEKIVGRHTPQGSGFRLRPVLIFVLYSHMNYCMYPITLIIQLTILFGTSCGSLHGRDRLDCVAPRQVIVSTRGLGVIGRRCEIPKATKRPSVGSSRAARTLYWSATKAEGLRCAKPNGSSRNDLGRIVHYAWLNFTGRRCISES